MKRPDLYPNKTFISVFIVLQHIAMLFILLQLDKYQIYIFAAVLFLTYAPLIVIFLLTSKGKSPSKKKQPVYDNPYVDDIRFHDNGPYS